MKSYDTIKIYTYGVSSSSAANLKYTSFKKVTAQLFAIQNKRAISEMLFL